MPTMQTMQTDDILNRTSFGLLEDPKGRFGSFAVSAITNIVLAGLLVLFTMAQLHRVAARHYEQTQLIFPVEPPKASPPPVPKVKVIPPPPKLRIQPQVAKITPPKVEVPEPPKIQPIPIKAPEMPKLPPPPPKAVTPPPQPKVGLFASNNPTPVANNKVAPTATKPAGFGDPLGAVPNPNSTAKNAPPAVGSFSGAPGLGAPSAGAARKGAVQGVSFGSGVANGVPGGTSRGTVASAGFTNGVIGGQPGGVPGGKVQSGAFGGGGVGTATPAAQKQQAAPAATPPELTFSVKPQYTQEARAAKLEGKVVLHVRILSSGHVEVLGVIRGLGQGLDEQARRAAEQFRFKPATRGGSPVDFTTDIQITFQLA